MDETLRQDVERLADEWMREQAQYPPEGAMGAAAVSLCAKELRALLAEHRDEHRAPECECEPLPVGPYNGDSTHFEFDSTYCPIHGTPAAPEPPSEVTETQLAGLIASARLRTPRDASPSRWLARVILNEFNVTRKEK